MKDFFRFLISKAFLQHLGLAIVAMLLIFIITLFSLRLYTQHGRSMDVPDFKGLTLIQVEDVTDQHDLTYIIVDSVHMNNMPRGVIVDQSPKPGAKVKKGRTIFLSINSLNPEKVLIPRVIDYSLRNATNILESYGLKVGKLKFVPSEFSNLIIGQTINGKSVEPGTPVVKGTTIDLIVGQGLSSETTNTPDLLGLTIEEASSYLSGQALNIGTIAFDTTLKTSTDTLSATIWKQSPTPDESSKIQVGASIDIWVSTSQSQPVEKVTP
jgi:beta-lactam-binding protein with PASTA domain